MKQFSLLLIAFFMNFGAQASHVAVVDSGTDFSHEWLQNRIWFNTNEIADNLVDDDRNGKVDDLVGWSFADNYNEVFFPEHLQSLDPKIFQIFEVIARIQAETDTEADRKFLEENVRQLPKEQKEALINQLNFYGQYAHGTHVSGIVALLAPQARILSGRVFPDMPLANVPAASHSTMGVVDWLYKLIATVSGQMFHTVAGYLNERGAQVANYSLGVPLSNIAKMSLSVRGNKNPTAEEVSNETKRLAAQYIPEGEKWIAASPKTLFVVAAGNDGQDNNVLPTFPANVRAVNSITVAATIGNEKLASFSNYGETTVDIAAPGTAIVSSVPSLDHKQLLPMSGTSMAAPYISGVAAHILDVNPTLTPQQVKEVLMLCVDQKDWLTKKVVSGGVVNPMRSYKVAELMKTMSITQAVALAKNQIADQPEALLPAKPMKFDPRREELRKLANSIVF